MRQSKIVSDEQHDFVAQACAENMSRPNILNALKEEFDIDLGLRTLGKYIKKHDLKRREFIETRDPDFDIFFIGAFFDTLANDEELAILCTQAGWKLSARNAQRKRWMLGLYKRATAGRPGMPEDELKSIVEAHFETDSIRSYGRELLYTHFRQKGYLVTRYVIS